MVCLLDDDAAVRRALTRLLRSHGFRVEAFATAGQFLQRVQVEQFLCAVLVLDINLGETNGFDVHDQLTNLGLAMPTIFITGHDEVGGRERALRVGGRAYLLKPLDEAALVTAIRMTLPQS
jgi:FixJ family two-component response regulator